MEPSAHTLGELALDGDANSSEKQPRALQPPKRDEERAPSHKSADEINTNKHLRRNIAARVDISCKCSASAAAAPARPRLASPACGTGLEQLQAVSAIGSSSVCVCELWKS